MSKKNENKKSDPIPTPTIDPVESQEVSEYGIDPVVELSDPTNPQKFQPNTDGLDDLPPPPVESPRQSYGRDIFLAFPCYKDTNPATAWALVATALDMGKDRMRLDIRMGDAMIYHSRNQLADEFLRSDAKYLLFLDDDMVPPIGRPDITKNMCRLPDNYDHRALSLHWVERLLEADASIVSATYFSRKMEGVPVNSLADDASYRRAVAEFADRRMEASWAGTGCMLIKRQVFEDIRENFPELGNVREPTMPFNYFHPGQDGTGEDIAFCERAYEVGHQTFVDCQLQVMHVGRMAYGFHTSVYNRLG